VPALHHLQGRLAAQDCLRMFLVVEPDIAKRQRLSSATHCPAQQCPERVRQRLHVDMEISQLKGLESAALWPERVGRKNTQVSHTAAPKAVAQPRARDIRIQGFPHNGKRFVKEDQNARCRAAATAAWVGVRVACSRCDVWLRSA
jgi:hypothetical protein